MADEMKLQIIPLGGATEIGKNMTVYRCGEQLLVVARDELPHSIATRVTEWELPRVRVEILVERDSQKGIVIGHGGETLKQIGTMARGQMELLLGSRVYLDLRVKVVKEWQRDPKALNRLGF